MSDKKLLVTTDGSARSWRILPHAAAFATATGAEIVLLQLLGAARGSDSLDPERARARLDKILRGSGIGGRMLVERARRDEDVSAAILRVARDEEVGMVAMHSRGRGVVSTALLGSATRAVLGRSDLPVMVSGPSIDVAPAAELYRILVTSDGSARSAHVVAALRPWLASSRIAVTLLRVHLPELGDRGDEEVRVCRAGLEALRGEFPPSTPLETRVETKTTLGGPAEVILTTARGMNAIALSTRGAGLAHDVLVGSVGLRLLRNSSLPVILARPS